MLVTPFPVRSWAVSSGDDSSGMSAPVPLVVESVQRLTPPKANETNTFIFPTLFLCFITALFAVDLIFTPLWLDRSQKRNFLVFGKLRLEGG